MRYKLPVRALLLIALGVSAYLLFVSFSGSAVAGCGPDSGCDRVLQSRWSRLFGIPVSAFSVLIYGALFAATFRFTRKAEPATQRATWRMIIPLIIVVIASVLWFAALQIGVLKQMCPLCMTVHGAGLVASVLLLLAAPIEKAPEKPWQAEKQVYVPPRVAAIASIAALGAFAVFATGQVLYKPKTYSFQTYDGKFQFDLNDVPLIGSPKVTNAIVSLFDYTCHHCRIMHWHLMDAHNKLSNQLSIISLPNPLDSRCNSNVRTPRPNPHQDACDYAKLGLAVWRANRKVHHQFDDWLFTPEQPPTVAQAHQFAANLVGSNQLSKAMEDPWVSKTLQLGITVYSTNYIHFKMGNMPQLIIGTNIVLSTFRDTAQMYQMLEQHLGIKAPSS
jgi:uncharacterized membrane protein